MPIDITKSAPYPLHKFDHSDRAEHGLRDLAGEWATEFGIWPPDDVFSYLSKNKTCEVFYFRDGTNWIAAAIVLCSGNSAELLYFYVRKNLRKKKIGGSLLQMVLESLAAHQNIDELLLEVRPSNLPAQGLYQRLDFERIGLRPHYYSNGEDAVIYRKRL